MEEITKKCIKSTIEDIQTLLHGIYDCSDELRKMDIPNYSQLLYIGDYTDEALEYADTLLRLLKPIMDEEDEEK